jgi:hypothetical protein
MSIYRSYFNKNSTLIKLSEINNSQNPVTEISYGTLNKQVSRFIFSIDITDLKNRIDSGEISIDSVQKHVLKMTNTIAYRPDLLGRKSYDGSTDRASSFVLELFNIDEEWDEGSGYDFVYDDEIYITNQVLSKQPVNWYYRKTNQEWTVEGAYATGATGTTVIGSQSFIKGNENLEIDITDYVNFLLGLGTGFTGTTFGLGIKFIDELENLETINRQAVAFHTKYTNTFYEPFVETTLNDTIQDDRNYFFLDKENELYLYSTVGGNYEDIIVSAVTIYDYQDNEILTIAESGITKVKKGVYKISLTLDSDTYVDSVLCTDKWYINQNGKAKTIEQEFYLIKPENYFGFSLDNRLNFDDFYFSYSGIKSDEYLKSGEKRKIKVNVKRLYSQNEFLPLELEYRIYTTQSDKYQIDIVPFTKVNRTLKGYEFDIDTSWLIPQDYYLELRLSNSGEYSVKSPLRFTIVNNGLF